MKHKLLLLWSWFVRTILYFFPDVPFIMRFRGWLYGLGMKSCGKDFQVTHDAIIRDLQNITVGDNCVIGNHAIVMGSGLITICDQVLIAPHSVIISNNHSSIDNSYRYGKSISGEITIERGAWVATNSTIAQGGGLPCNSVLAANSFLNKRVTTPNSIYGGVPAVFIKQLEAD